jgi:3-deoxy-D-arabino-heptulosonate 7-phosphate (DAHP) synthase
MLGKKNSLANRLLQQLPNNKQPNKLTKDIKEFINSKLSALEYIASPLEMEVGMLLEDLYLEES